MIFRFSKRSKDKLYLVNPDLVGIAYRVLSLSNYDFGITSGWRTVEEQEKLFNAGKSTTMNSKHLTGNAIDFVVYIEGMVTWERRYYEDVAKAFKQAANEYGIGITWGGDWKSFKDGPHIELK